MTERSKRNVPSVLKEILKFDSYMTKRFVLWGNSILPLRTFRVHYKGLEISCHGIPWLSFWIAFTWLFDNPNLIQMQVNMLLGLVLDIIFVAVAKAYFRRRRPILNTDDALGQMGPDVFSFPSGHASRAIFVVYFFTRLWPLHWIFHFPLLAWVTSICLSRVMMSRHYILDVLGGCALGILEGFLMEFLWIEDSTARSLFSVVSDEKIDGGEYHV
ncbi:polyisoprenoid diphosphate/phosphate phosphohydrolase PLPP6 [Leptinotarsa decemlineata]|uniref:polyisoprenoid diphosphate/phosphate phosphohydrolase PLPP6 n=1 Tax=Leptinotarsa decemlineata TaxID=7539 RepID=UPI003D30CA64